MFPFDVDPGWYDKYWLTDRAPHWRKPRHAGLAGLIVLMALLAGSGLVLNQVHAKGIVSSYQAWEEE
jgi:hypothetical protein